MRRLVRRLVRGDRLVLATHNAGKLRELDELLAPYGIATLGAGALGLAEPEETAPDFAGNARLKARAAARAAGLPALADDSGLVVPALGGAPGIFSARWAGPGRDFRAAMARVERELDDAADRSAWFVCVLCLAWPEGTRGATGGQTGGESGVFEGRVDGVLRWPPAGVNGFGYDPIFVPAGSTRSYGEMSPAEKHATDHRARAMAAFAAACLPAAEFAPAASVGAAASSS